MLTTVTRICWRWSCQFISYVLLISAILLVIFRLSLPTLAEHYHDTIEAVLSEQLHTGVRISQLSLDWWGWGLILQVQGFRLYTKDHEAFFSFRHARARLDVSRSLLSGRPVLRDMHLSGGQLLLQLTADNTLKLLPHSSADFQLEFTQVLAWLGTIENMDIHFERLILRDHHNQQLSEGRDLQLHLSHATQHQPRLHSSVTLIKPYEQQIAGIIELQEYNDIWQADFYLHSEIADLRYISPLAQGSAAVELWGKWQDNRIYDVIGNAAVERLALASSSGNSAVTLPNTEILFTWQPAAKGWHWHGQWQLENTTSHVVLSQQQQRLRGAIHKLSLASLTPYINAWLTSYYPELSLPQVQGEIPELAIAFTPENQHYELAARFENLSSAAWQQVPGITQLSGQIAVNPGGGSVVVDSQAVGVISELLRAPLLIDQLRGILHWQHSTDDMQLTIPTLRLSNADLTTQLTGNIRWQEGQTPRFNLEAQLQDIDIARIRDYLPTKLMRPKLVSWINRALISGRSQGYFTFHGSIEDFPFADQQGLMELRLQIKDTVLAYFPGWPRLENLAAEILLRNNSLLAQSQQGSVYDIPLTTAQAQIADIKDPFLIFDSVMEGPGPAFLEFVKASPLQKTVGRYLADMTTTGRNSLQVNLNIPLKKQQGKSLEVSGNVGFAGGSVALPQQDLLLNDIQGGLRFTKQALAADDIKLNFRGSPAQLAITSKVDNSTQKLQELQFRLQGQFGREALFGKAAADFAPHINGKSHWDVLLRVPAPKDTAANNIKQYDLLLRSKLTGTRISLPEPLAKNAGTSRAITARVAIRAGRDMQFDVNYEPDSHAVLQLVEKNKQLQLSRGELKINAGKATLPSQAGFFVVARLARHNPFAAASSSTAPPEWLRRIEATVDQLQVGSYHLRETQISVQHQQQQLQVALNGPDIRGNLVVPVAVKSNQPLRVQLQRLALRDTTEEEADATAEQDPRTWPPLQIDIQNLLLNDQPLGHLALTATPQAAGLHIDQLKLDAAWHEFNADGEWLIRKNGQNSALKATFKSQELGKSLAPFGYSVDLEKAPIEASIDLQWPGSLASFDLPIVNGSVDFSVGKGRLLDIDPGLGRLIGLFNLYSLARRLRLDFSDFFGAGLAFDRINGKVRFADNHAYTEPIFLEGPATKILIEGKVDLSSETYDQTLSVMPQLGTPLAIAGALAGGPVVGAAVLFAEKLLKIDRAVRYRYAVTGSWDDPTLEPLGADNQAIEDSGWTGNR